MHASRTRFKKEIVAEFMVPTRKLVRQAHHKPNKVIILCGGMPSYPGKKEDLMEWLSKKGYWVFIPRYRGTWESGGEFLKKSPHQDVIDVMDGVQTGFTDLWSHTKYKIPTPKFYLIGSSFGGPAAILASTDKRVKKAIALSPVVDWTVEKDNEIDNLRKFTEFAFGNAYRFTKKNWNKLKQGKFYSDKRASQVRRPGREHLGRAMSEQKLIPINFYNPMNEVKKLDGKKLMIIHAKDDKVVSYKPSEEFSSILNSKFLLLPKGGHISTSEVPKFWKKISSFLK